MQFETGPHRSSIHDKLTAFRKTLAERNCKTNEAALIGDDVIDLPVMWNCVPAMAVANARAELKKALITSRRMVEETARCVTRLNTFSKHRDWGTACWIVTWASAVPIAVKINHGGARPSLH
jgi:hypothetical protein